MISSCKLINGNTDNQATDNEKYHHTYIKAVYSPPLTFDPIKMNDTESLLFSNLIYDGLLKFSPALELEGQLAESWSTSIDGKEIDLTLKRNISFHNGKPVTAKDVVYSLRRAVSPQSKVFKYYNCIKGSDKFHSGKTDKLEGIFEISSHHIKIILKYPFPPFLSILAGGTAKIIPFEQSTSQNFFKAPIGSGPYKYIKTQRTSNGIDTVLEKYRKYHGKKPKIKNLILRATSKQKAFEGALNGEIHDLSNWPLNGKETVFNTGQHIRAPVAATWIIGLNTRLKPFDDLSNRRVFRASIDSEKFRKKFYPKAFRAYGYIPPGIPGHKNIINHEDHKYEQIKVKKHKKIKIAFPKDLPQGEEMKDFLFKSFKSHGWNVEIVSMEWDDLMKGYDNKTLQAFLVSMNMDYPDTEFLIRNFESQNDDNFSGLKNNKIDILLNKARSTQDRIKRNDIYRSIIKIIEDESVTVNLFHPTGHYWIHSCVKGFVPNILADVYIDYRDVWVDKACLKNKE